MKVQFGNKTIEVTKTFAEKATHFGSEEYNMLRTAMQDLPDFKIVVKGTRNVRCRNTLGGMTYEQMSKYISTLENPEELYAEFMKLRECGCNYAQVKQWFLRRCPEAQNFAA